MALKCVRAQVRRENGLAVQLQFAGVHVTLPYPIRIDTPTCWVISEVVSKRKNRCVIRPVGTTRQIEVSTVFISEEVFTPVGEVVEGAIVINIGNLPKSKRE